MRTNYVLIDFESVQPAALEHLAHDHFKVIVFVGAAQVKLPFEVAASLQEFGSRAEYVKISGNGSNALDFHIAYYIGRLAVEEPSAHFHIISKDTGFDPLIQHLKSKQILAGRFTNVAEIPAVKASNSKSPQERIASKDTGFDPLIQHLKSRQIPAGRVKNVAESPAVKGSNSKAQPERIATVLARLQQVKASKPRTVKTLSSTIASWFQNQLSKDEVASLVQGLVDQGYLKITGAKVSYALPGDV